MALAKVAQVLPDAERRILWGIGLVCIAGTLFPLMNSMAKMLTVDYSSLQVSWARFFGHVVLVLAVFLPRRGWRLVLTRRPTLQLGRSVIQCSSNLSFTAAIAYQPIADASAISMMGPLFVILLAWPMLGERTRLDHGIAVAVGFIGVLIVIRPGGDLFHWSALGLVASSVFYALYQVFTRKVANIDPPETTTFYSSAFGAIGMLLVMPFVWRTPTTLRDIVFFCAIGSIGAIGHYCVVRALAYAPANIASPFQYFQLIGSVILGYFMFGHFPDAATWIGAGIIVGAGLYVGWAQTRRRA